MIDLSLKNRNTEVFIASPFLESVRADMRLRAYSIRTEKSYLHWIRRYIYFCGKRHPEECGNTEVKAFLSHLANDRNVAVNTQKVALNATVYLYQKFLNRELGELDFKLASKKRSLSAAFLKSLNSTIKILRLTTQH